RAGRTFQTRGAAKESGVEAARPRRGNGATPPRGWGRGRAAPPGGTPGRLPPPAPAQPAPAEPAPPPAPAAVGGGVRVAVAGSRRVVVRAVGRRVGVRRVHVEATARRVVVRVARGRGVIPGHVLLRLRRGGAERQHARNERRGEAELAQQTTHG